MTSSNRLLQGKYLAGKLLGKGCAGSVYEATCVDDGRLVAMKTCFAKSFDDDLVEQYLREAAVMKRITVPGWDGASAWIPWIVNIEDFWVDELAELNESEEEGVNVNVIMDLVDGMTLEGYLERLSHPRMKFRSRDSLIPGESLESKNEMSTELMYSWVAQISLALHLIHSLRIIHRDIKPGNLLLSKDMRSIKLADFSIAKCLGPDESEVQTSAGTLNYCAPEVLLNRPYGDACDMWSLGCVLYEMLTLEKRFKASSPGRIIQAVTKGDVATIPDDADPGLSMICQRLLNSDPSKRPSAQSVCLHPKLRKDVVTQLNQLTPPAFRDAVTSFLNFDAVMGDNAISDISCRSQPDHYTGDLRSPNFLDHIQGEWKVCGEDSVSQTAKVTKANVVLSGGATYTLRFECQGSPFREWCMGSEYKLSESDRSTEPQRFVFAPCEPSRVDRKPILVFERYMNNPDTQ